MMILLSAAFVSRDERRQTDRQTNTSCSLEDQDLVFLYIERMLQQ